MRLALALAGLMLLQLGGLAAPENAAEPQHLRYERAILLPPGFAGGAACVVLDAAALAHTASRSYDDLRVFEQQGNSAPVETPFVLTESEAAPGYAETATVENLGVRGGAIDFDLAMPRRRYSEVDLQLGAKNFLGEAEVWGLQGRSESKPGPEESVPVALGSFAIFDLSGQGLARSTALPLQEATFPVLHIELRLRGVKGGKLTGLSAQMVQGAVVPPSREAQTLYTTVASTTAIRDDKRWSNAEMEMPAHVPVERVSFVLDPQFRKNFLRDVTVVGKPDAGNGIVPAEAVDGEIWREARSGLSGGPAIHADKLNVEAVLGSNLREPATITVVVKNGNQPPLPLRAIELQMRQRQVCFRANADGRYTLRYGDPGLAAPAYGAAAPGSLLGLPNSESNSPAGGPANSPANRLGSEGLTRQPRASPEPAAAQLGPERINPHYVARAQRRPYSESHPELFWVVLLVSFNVLCALVMQGFKRRGETR